MEWKITKDENEMAVKAAHHIADVIRKKKTRKAKLLS